MRLNFSDCKSAERYFYKYLPHDTNKYVQTGKVPILTVNDFYIQETDMTIRGS